MRNNGRITESNFSGRGALRRFSRRGVAPNIDATPGRILPETPVCRAEVEVSR
jgi:hypothetical protein